MAVDRIKVDRRKPQPLQGPYLSDEESERRIAVFREMRRREGRQTGGVDVNKITGEAYEWISWERYMSE